MPKRLAELEAAVAQLQATVDGVREELVDANERIRTLEHELDMDSPQRTTEAAFSETGTTEEESAPENIDEPEESPDEIIVA